MNILVIEDDLRLSEAIKELLIANDYKVDVVNSGSEGIEYGESGLYDLIILDIMLPQVSGFNVLKVLRSKHICIPIILLTAKNEVDDRVLGLDYGADDYLTKPFYTDELLARIRALLRRPSKIITNCIEYHDIRINTNSFILSCKNKSIQLSKKEYQLMKILILNKESIVAKDILILKVWGIHSNADDNNVEAYISFLRKKLNYINSIVSIKTVRKVGYGLEV